MEKLKLLMFRILLKRKIPLQRHLYYCYSEDECLALNKKYDVGKSSKYVWNDINSICSYKLKPGIEHRVFGKPKMPTQSPPTPTPPAPPTGL